jgi:uncharacterized protein YecE (DUF72 family)
VAWSASTSGSSRWSARRSWGRCSGSSPRTSTETTSASPPRSHELTADWTFIRFHHGSRGRNGNYSERELQEWADRITEWRRRVEVFAYFNNDWNGYAVKNAGRLKVMLGLER